MSGREVLRGVFYVGCLLWSTAFVISGVALCIAAATLVLVVIGGAP